MWQKDDAKTGCVSGSLERLRVAETGTYGRLYYVRIFLELLLGLLDSDNDASVRGDEEVCIPAEGALRSSLDEFVWEKRCQ